MLSPHAGEQLGHLAHIENEDRERVVYFDTWDKKRDSDLRRNVLRKKDG